MSKTTPEEVMMDDERIKEAKSVAAEWCARAIEVAADSTADDCGNYYVEDDPVLDEAVRAEVYAIRERLLRESK